MMRPKEDRSRTITWTGFRVPYTADYCAPEVTQGKPLTRKADVYSLGVMLTRLLLLQEPDVTSQGELSAGSLKEHHDTFKCLVASRVPEVLEQASALEPENRYDSLDVFWQELEKELTWLGET